MALSPRVQGAPRPAQLITWLRGDGSAEDLTGSTLTGVIYDERTGAARAVTGALELSDADAGQFTWEHSADDVSIAGLFLVQFTATFPTGLTPARTLGDDWEVTPAYAP